MIRPAKIYQVWRADEPSTTKDIEARSPQEAVKEHIEETWVPLDDDLIEYVAKEPDGTLWDLTVEIEMEPHFDVFGEKRSAISDDEAQGERSGK